MGRSRKSVPKAVDRLIDRSRNGDLTIRSECITSYRVRVLKLASGAVKPNDEETPEELAGATLEAEFQQDTHALRTYYEQVHKGN